MLKVLNCGICAHWSHRDATLNFFSKFYFNRVRREILKYRLWCETLQQHCIGWKRALQWGSNVTPVGDPLIASPLLHEACPQPCALLATYLLYALLPKTWACILIWKSTAWYLDDFEAGEGGRRVWSCALGGFTYLLAILMCRWEATWCNCASFVVKVDWLWSPNGVAGGLDWEP